MPGPLVCDIASTELTDHEAAARSLTAAGYVMASELRACGVDFTFAPVLDLDWGKCEVIGERAFSLDPRVVTRLARALSQGMLIAGMANCGKHFPGHGFVSADSHKEPPVDDRGALFRDDRAYPLSGFRQRSRHVLGKDFERHFARRTALYGPGVL